MYDTETLIPGSMLEIKCKAPNLLTTTQNYKNVYFYI
jgi:hypothetical protein